MTDFFAGIDKVRYEGPDSRNPLAFRWYDPGRVVLGKTMAEHFRFAVCYWHTFCWPGSDMFGPGTFARPWQNVRQLRECRAETDGGVRFLRKTRRPVLLLP